MVKEGLLFVSYYFPPSKSIAAVRNFNLCTEFLKSWDVYVFTTSNQKWFHKDDFPSLPVKRIKKLLTFDLRTLIRTRPLKSKVNSSRTHSFTHKVLRSFPFNIFIGIGGLFYIIHGFFLGCRYIKKYNVKVLYSSYFPYSDHIICYLLKKCHRNIQWVADFRDLHYYPHNDEIVFPRIQRFFNYSILKNASLLSTVSEGLKKHLTAFNQNVLVVRNAIGPLSKIHNIDLEPRKREELVLAYTGNIVPGKSSVESIFEILTALQKDAKDICSRIKFKYVGAYHEYFDQMSEKYGVGDLCKISKTVPITDSIRIQKSADINILLSFNSPGLSGILTGKFFEYLGAEKPILLIINGSRDEEFETIFDELNCGKVVYVDDPNLIKKALSFIDFVRLNLNSPELQYKTEKLSEYTSEFQGNKIATHLKNFK